MFTVRLFQTLDMIFDPSFHVHSLPEKDDNNNTNATEKIVTDVNYKAEKRSESQQQQQESSRQADTARRIDEVWK